MASSQTEVVNIALTILGADLITSIDDPVKSAILASANWNTLLDATIRAYPWNFAIKNQVLSPESATPVDSEWTYQFTLPPECLRVLKTDLTDQDWVVEGRNLYANSDTVKLKFLQRVDDTNVWDACFTQAFAVRMAHLLSYPIVQSGALKQNLWEDYRRILGEARTIDAQEGRLTQVEADAWVESRLS